MLGQDPDSAFTPTEPAVPPHKSKTRVEPLEKSQDGRLGTAWPQSQQPNPCHYRSMTLPCITREEMGFSMTSSKRTQGMPRGHSLKNEKIVFPSTTFSIISSQILLRIHPSFPISIWGKKCRHLPLSNFQRFSCSLGFPEVNDKGSMILFQATLFPGISFPGGQQEEGGSHRNNQKLPWARWEDCV